MAVIAIAEGNTPGAALKARKLGERVVLGLGQHVTSDVTKSGTHILRTLRYRYLLSLEGEKDAIVRWDYDRQRPESNEAHCRHHLQGTQDIVVSGRHWPLDNFHLPTGYVPIEEVIRFCVVDLGVKPLRSDWDDVLEMSYKRFRNNLRCPRYAECEQVAEYREE